MKMTFRRLIVWLLILMLLLPAGAFASPESLENQIIKQDVQVETALFDEALSTALSENEPEYDVLVYLSDQVNTNDYVVMGENARTYVEREAIAQDYIAALQEKAALTQRPILNYLSRAQEQGLVAEYEGLFIVNVIRVLGDASVIKAISRMPGIEKMELNQAFQLDLLEEPATEEEVVVPDSIPWNLSMIKADKVWEDYSIDGTGSVVGIIDSGVQFVHPALKLKWRGYDAATDDFVDPEKSWFEAIPSYFIDQSPYPVDGALDHGTHVAGIILGSENDGKNTIGVAPGAKYIAARAFDGTGNTDNYILLRAGQWMLAPGGDAQAKPDVVNASWTNPVRITDWYKPVIEAWRAADIVPVVASGNLPMADFTNPEIPINEIGNPANYKESFAVGSVERDGSLSYFSLVGPSRYNPDWIKPDISAPGGNIRSSIGTGNYGNKNGTSMAAPHVTGVVALLRQANPDLSVSEIETILKNTAVAATNSTYPTSPNMGYGYGIIDAYNAISEVMGRPEAVIQGRVSMPGTDDQAPQINVTIPSGVYERQDFTVTASASDNIGVERFYVNLTTTAGESTHEMTLVNGTQQNGQYEFYLEPELVEAGLMSFEFIAEDANGHTTSLTESRDIIPAIDPAVGYYQDFEAGLPGYRLTNTFQRVATNDWTFPDYAPAPSPIHLISGGNWISNTKPNYAELPPVDLSSDTLDAPQLSFMFRNYAAKGVLTELQVSHDYGQTWETIRDYTTDTTFWRYESIDLSEYKGDGVLFFRFFLQRTGENSSRGFFFDDVRVRVRTDDQPSVPTNLTLENHAHGVWVKWDQSTDLDISHYNIYRSAAGETTKVGSVDVIDESGLPNKLEFVDRSAVAGTEYSYTVRAVNFFDTESPDSQALTITYQPATMYYFSDFNQDDGGLTTSALGDNGLNDWQWGTDPTQSNTTGHWNTARDGLGVTNDSVYTLNLPVIEVGDQGATIIFDSICRIQWGDSEWTNLGEGRLQASIDGGTTWNTLIEPSEMFSYNVKDRWVRWQHELGEEYHNQTVHLRFHMTTFPNSNGNPSYPAYGWSIDNLTVMSGTGYRVMTVEVTGADSPELFEQPLVSAEGTEAAPQVLGEGRIPLAGATVRVLETGQATRTDQVGNYFIRQGMIEDNQTVTVEASAYGFHAKTATVELTPGAVVTQDFELEPLGRGSIRGTVTDESGQPIAGVNVSAQGISTPGMIVTAADGSYEFTGLYQGTYDLRFVHPDYRVHKEAGVIVEVGETTTVDVSLTASQSFDEWIIYDNGQSTDSIAFNDAGNGFAVRFTAEGDGILSAGNLYFVDDWPAMYGTQINIGVLDINLENGDIETLIPFQRYTINRGEWNIIDFSQYGIELEKGDTFFITTQQINSGGDNPALGVDSFSPYGDESFGYTGTYQRLIDINSETPGSLMIRAKIAYENKDIHPPTFTNFDETIYTNKATVALEGKVSEDGQVEIYFDDTLVETVTTAQRMFKTSVSVSEPTTELSAVLVGTNDRRSDASASHTIIYDTTAPSLTLDSYRDGQVLNTAEIVLSGTAEDTYFDKVLVNGYEAAMEGSRYSYPTTLKAGDNSFEIDAFDRAGNRERIHLTLHYDAEAVVDDLMITSVSPEEDIKLMAGKDYTITLRGSAGDSASARVILPIELQSQADSIALEETTPGVYTGTWTSPQDSTGTFYVTGRLEREGEVVEKQSLGSIELIDRSQTYERLAGDNRYHTAALFSQKQYDQADTVILANGTASVDALAATPLALATNAPILLTETDRVPQVTQAEIERLGASNIILIGGELVISQQVQQSFDSHYRVKRFDGGNRYSTSQLIAQEVMKYSQTDTVLVASGQSFIDAASIGPASKQVDTLGISPIIFVDPGETKLLSGPDRAILLGGELAISQATEDAITGQGYTIERIAGDDRYHTNTLIAQEFFSGATGAVVANGIDPIDAIAAGPYAGNEAMPILLVGEDVSSYVEAYIHDNPIQYFVFAGGTLAISDEVAIKLINLIW